MKTQVFLAADVRNILTACTVHLMIAVALGVVVDIILFHGMIL